MSAYVNASTYINTSANINASASVNASAYINASLFGIIRYYIDATSICTGLWVLWFLFRFSFSVFFVFLSGFCLQPAETQAAPTHRCGDRRLFAPHQMLVAIVNSSLQSGHEQSGHEQSTVSHSNRHCKHMFAIRHRLTKRMIRSLFFLWSAALVDTR